MKRLILFLFFITQILSLNGQSLVVTGSNSIMYNSVTSQGADTLDPCLQTHSYLTVKNLANKSLDILCEKNIISESSGASNYFCWGGNCYGVGTNLSTSHLSLASGQDDDVSFGGYFDAFCADAQATVEYCFFPDDDPADRACVYITYHAQATSISEQSPLVLTEFYPNPTKETLNFQYFLNKPAELIMMDILGNQIKTIALSAAGTKRVNISDFSKGIYFGNLVVDNEVIAIKKVIVK